jgi:hypothetical protein
MMVKAPGAREEHDLALSDVARVADISADGALVVFAEFGDVDTANGAYLRPTDGGAALRLGDGMPFDLADDGRGVLALRYALDDLAVFPVPEGQPRTLAVAGLAAVRWARWMRDGRVAIGGSAEGRPARVWRLDPDRALTPLTPEGACGAAAVRPDGGALAFVAGDRLHVVALDGGARVVPGAFADDAVCGWDAGGAEVLVRSASPPVRVRRVHVETGAETPLFEIAPPPVGRRGVDTLVVSARGDAYAYSYGQELSRLYTMNASRQLG